jgi:hypothetical protein
MTNGEVDQYVADSYRIWQWESMRGAKRDIVEDSLRCARSRRLSARAAGPAARAELFCTNDAAAWHTVSHCHRIFRIAPEQTNSGKKITIRGLTDTYRVLSCCLAFDTREGKIAPRASYPLFLRAWCFLTRVSKQRRRKHHGYRCQT